jgi:hypothetical protein
VIDSPCTSCRECVPVTSYVLCPCFPTTDCHLTGLDSDLIPIGLACFPTPLFFYLYGVRVVVVFIAAVKLLDLHSTKSAVLEGECWCNGSSH